MNRPIGGIQGGWDRLASTGEPVRRVILHVHRNPSTGVWSMMKNLAREQNRALGILAVLGIPADRDWCAGAYPKELLKADFPYVLASMPKLFGTGAFFWTMVTNPLRGWLKQLQQRFPEAEIVLHSHSAWLTGGYLPLPLNKRTALVATFHGIADDHRLRKLWWLSKAHRFLAQRLYCSGCMLTSVSRETAVRAEELFGIPATAFTVVTNGMPAPDLNAPKAIPREAGFLVGHVGQMHHGKGWRLLLEAVDRLHTEGRNIQLVLAGKGQDAEAAIAEASLRKEYVRFLGVVENACETLIPQLDAFVLATWSEGMPMAVVESLAAGVPVVATAVGGLPEMLKDNVNGLLIERNTDSIADALRCLMDDPETVARLRSGALNTFGDRFEISRVVSHYERLYDSALAHQLSGQKV